jgi:hypothetical protein
MTTTADQGYRAGGTWAVCDRCNFKRRLSALKKEWTGFMVCAECFDTRPPDISPPNLHPEGLPVRDARPDQGDVLGSNTTTADDLT